MSLLSLAAAIWWCGALALLALSSIAALAFPWPYRRSGAEAPAPPMTAIVPVRNLDPSFEAAQASLYGQVNPNDELLIGSAETRSAALDIISTLRVRYAEVDSRVVTSATRHAVSPKLNTIWAAVQQARHDLVLTKDSNVVLAPGDVAAFVRLLRPGVGLVSALTVLVEPRSAAAWVETAAINGHFARMLMLARALRMGFGLGKVMLFRRSDLDRAGGLGTLEWALGEDTALCDSLAAIGLRTVLADRLTVQHAGARSWRDVWSRLLRWKLIWRVQRPHVFAASLFDSALLAALAGALSAPLAGASPWQVAAATLAAWFGLESVVCAVRGWPLSIWSPIGFFGREAIELLVWARALTTSEVVWGGAVCRLNKGRSRPVPV